MKKIGRPADPITGPAYAAVQILAGSVLVQWIKGKQELIWPKEFATAAFAYLAPPFAQR